MISLPTRCIRAAPLSKCSVLFSGLWDIFAALSGDNVLEIFTLEEWALRCTFAGMKNVHNNS